MSKKSRRPRLETLEERTVLHGAPVALLSLSADHESYVLSDELESDPVQIIDEGDATRWSPELYGDFTNDGVDDVLGRLDNGSWWLQINDGTKLYNVPWGGALIESAEIIQSSDINDDGLLDVISIDRTTGDIGVSVNTSNGLSNQLWATLPMADPTNLFVDDFNGDGLVDLLASDSDETWWLAENTVGSFTVQEWGRFPDFGWLNVVSGHFNADSTADVAARAPDNTWWVWFGAEDGMQQAQYWGHWRMRDNWHDVAVVDLNNDGLDDLIGRTEDGRLWVGTATDTRFHTWTWSTGWVNRAEWSHITHIDINDDGLMDQVGKAHNDTWWYAQNTGEQSFQNYFWQTAEPEDFTVFANNFQRDEAIDITSPLPFGGTDVTQADVVVNLNDDDKIVISGADIEIIALELISDSGALIPAPSADPFEVLLSNLATNYSVGNFTAPAHSIDGGLVLGVGWDTNSQAQDLVASYGVDERVLSAVAFEPLGMVPVPTEDTQAETNEIYFRTVPKSRVQFPDA